MLEFAGKVTLLDPPPELDVYDMVQVQAGKLDLALIVMPEKKSSVPEPDPSYTLEQFLADAHKASALKLPTAATEIPQSVKPPAEKPASTPAASAFLSKLDWSIIEVVRAEPNLKMSGIARRLKMSLSSSHLRARLANLAVLQILISSSRSGYSLGPKAPAQKPAETPAKPA